MNDMMSSPLGDIKIKVVPEQVENVIITVEHGVPCVSIAEKNCLDTLLSRKLIIGGLNSFLNEMVEKKLEELKMINEGR